MEHGEQFGRFEGDLLAGHVGHGVRSTLGEVPHDELHGGVFVDGDHGGSERLLVPADLHDWHGVGVMVQCVCQVGAMAEIPFIALMAAEVAEVADFVSIGTNDLTQYTMAADRTLGSVAGYQTAWPPAVLRAIKLICDASNAKGMPVGVCGEAAADPDLAVVLTGLGVNSLSMTPVALDDVRAQLAEVTFEEAQAKAKAALNGDFYKPAQ